MSTPHETRPLPPVPWGSPGTDPGSGRGTPDDAPRPAGGSRPAGPAAGARSREWGPWSPRTLFFGTTDLVVDAALGTLWLTALVSLVSAGFASLAALVGVVLLVAAIYASATHGRSVTPVVLDADERFTTGLRAEVTDLRPLVAGPASSASGRE